jgi:hypothetical protein
MKHFLEILADVRLGTAEVGGTLAFVFLVVYGIRKAWDDFIGPIFK